MTIIDKNLMEWFLTHIKSINTNKNKLLYSSELNSTQQIYITSRQHAVICFVSLNKDQNLCWAICKVDFRSSSLVITGIYIIFSLEM